MHDREEDRRNTFRLKDIEPDTSDFRIRNVYALGEAKPTFPYQRTCTIRFQCQVDDGGHWHELSCDIKLPHNRPIDEIVIVLYKDPHLGSPDIDDHFSRFDEQEWSIIPDEIQLTFVTESQNRHLTVAETEPVSVRVPIRRIPVRADRLSQDIHLPNSKAVSVASDSAPQCQHLFNWKHHGTQHGMSEGESDLSSHHRSFTPSQLAAFFQSLLTSQSERPVKDVNPIVAWLKGGIRQGKSTYVQQVCDAIRSSRQSQTTIDGSDSSYDIREMNTTLNEAHMHWCIVELTTLCYRPNEFTITRLQNTVFDKLAEITGYEDAPGKRAKRGENPENIDKHIQNCLAILGDRRQGLMVVLDEFDLLWNPKPCKVSASEILNDLIRILSLVPPSASGTNVGRLPTLIFVADNKLPDERISAPWPIPGKACLCSFRLDPAYTPNDVTSLIDEMLPVFRYDPNQMNGMVDRILSWTSGHRGLTNALLYHLVEFRRKHPSKSETVEMYLDEVLSDAGSFRDIFVTLEDVIMTAHKELYDSMSDRPDLMKRIQQLDSQRLTPSERQALWHIERGYPTNESVAESDLTSLVTKGLVTKTESRFEVAIPLLSLYLRRVRI